MRKIHIIGICGIGMSAIAQYCKENEYIVQGSDAQINNAIANHLISKNIQIYSNSADNITNDIDFIVKSTAIKSTDSEIIQAQQLNIPILSRSDMLSQITQQSNCVISISGAHGKTTTTTMTAELFELLQGNATVFSGGVMEFCKNNFLSGGKELMIVEADESDGTFMNLKTNIAALTNVEFEHAEYYKDFSNMLECCEEFINGKHVEKVVLCGDDIGIQQIHSNKQVIRYGVNNNNDIYYEHNKVIIYQKYIIDNPQFNFLGKHNILNSLCALSIGIAQYGLTDKVVSAWKEMISTYRGVHRRFNIVSKSNNITIIDDYAHHPTEIAVTIETAKQMNQRVIAVVQPHRYTRLFTLMNDFVACMNEADICIITDIYSAGENEIPNINGKVLYENIQLKIQCNQFNLKSCYFAEGQNEVYELINEISLSGDIILFMGAGTITNWAREYK